MRREWASPEIAGELGIDPQSEVAAQRLAAYHGLAPAVLEYNRASRFLLMSFVEGLQLERDWIKRPERRAAMQVLITRLRSIVTASLPTLDLSARLCDLHERLVRRSPDCAEVYREELYVCLYGLSKVVDGAEVLVHGDLIPENVLVRADGSLCLLDWEYAHCGHGDEDLAGLALDHTELRAWSLAPEDFDLRVRARRLLNELWHALAATWVASGDGPGQTI